MPAGDKPTRNDAEESGLIERRPTQPAPESIAVQLSRRETLVSSGPIPQPHILKEYGEIIPDAPERILRLAEDEAKFRRDMTLRQENRASLAMLTATGLTLVGFGVAALAVTLHDSAAACTIGGGTIVAIVTSFLARVRADDRHDGGGKQDDKK